NFADAKSGKPFEPIFPHDRSVQAVIAEGDKVDIDEAVSAARAAYDGGWGAMRPSELPRILLRMADLIEERASELTQLETLDVGMPSFLATGMVMSAAGVFRCWGGWGGK